MENFTITTIENGDVAVACQYYDWTSDSYVKSVERYTEIGRYVYRVCDNGSTAQICEGLRATGPTLMLSGSLEETIRKTLRS